MLEKVKLSELVFDYDLYPRVAVDSSNVRYMRQALAAGHVLPPVVVDKKTKVLVDGVHRVRLYRSIHEDPNHKIEADVRDYKSKADMLADAALFNSSHGKNLTRVDRARCVLLAKKHRLSIDRLAAALHMKTAEMKALSEGRIGYVKSNGSKTGVALKQSIKHMAGLDLTDDQVEANNGLSGMNQTYHANQLLLLIRNELLDTSNDVLMHALRELHTELTPILK